MYASIEAVIAEYLSEHRPGDWPVSIASGRRAIREKHPDLPIEDAELDALLERVAVLSGLNVEFDHGGAP